MQMTLMWLNVFGREAKNAFLVLLGRFWAYVWQPHGHIGLATSMPFASFNPTYLRTNPWKFRKNILRIGRVEKLSCFWVGHFDFFASFPWKLVTNYVLESMGLNFYYYDGLQPKMSVGIINEHECMYLLFIYPKKSKIILELKYKSTQQLCT